MSIISRSSVIRRGSDPNDTDHASRWKKYREHVLPPEDAPLCTLSYFSLLKKLAFSDTFASIPNAVDVSARHCTAILVDKVRVELNMIRFGLAKLRNSVSELLLELSFGKTIDLNLSDIEDQRDNSDIGYRMTYGDERQNTAAAKLLFHTIYFSPELKIKYFTKSTDGQTLVLLRDSADKWLANYDVLQRQLLVLLHTTSGMPARAPELSSYRLSNGETAPRTVFWIPDLAPDGKTSGNLCLQPHYNKSANYTMKEPLIYRFLSPEDSLFFLKDIIVLRPFACFLLSRHGAPLNQIDGFKAHLFVCGGAQSDACHIRRNFQRQFNESFGIPVSFSQWRQTVAVFAWHSNNSELKGTFLKYWYSTEVSEEEEEVSLAAQFGHTFKISQIHYGKTNNVRLFFPFILIPRR